MGIFSRATDYYLTYKFIKALIQPFNKTDAYKLGIIDDEGNIITCNKAGLRILKLRSSDIVGKTSEEFFTNGRSWIMEKVRECEETKEDNKLDEKLKNSSDSY